MSSGLKYFKKTSGNFLLSAQLEDPDARLGRRKRARLRAEQREAKELAAEKRPRTQERWLEEERLRSKLPTAEGAQARPAEAPGSRKATADGDEAVGRKKAKRLEILNKKKAQKESKRAVGEAKAASAAITAATKGKVKDGEVSERAAELIAKCAAGALGEQRLLASVAERVAAEPERELDLFDVFLVLHNKGSDYRTRLLALLSGIAVFKDLVPGYRIREPTEQEKSVQRSRETLQLEKHEMGLLKTYRRILPLLEAAMRRDPCAFAPALAALVKAACDFNYRQRLIGTAVKHASSEHELVRQVVAEGLREVVQSDQRLEASREVVLAIGRLAQAHAASRKKGGASGAKAGDAGAEEADNGSNKEKPLGLQSELFKVLLCLPIGKSEEAALRETNAAELEGADEDVKRGLAEASISQGAEKLRKTEVELLYEIFVVYLRILRQRHLHGRELLSAVLAGLARWGQQVNLELLLEILDELRNVVQDAISQSNELVALQGLNCAMVLLSGPSQALMTDVTWLADCVKTALVLALPSLHSVHSESSEWPPQQCFCLKGRRLRASVKQLAAALETESVPALVLSCLQAALRCPQAYGRASDAALATLIEHLFLLAAAADPHVGLALLREAAILLRRHHRLHTLLDVEGGLFGLGGVTDRAVSVVWHLQAIGFSSTPAIAKAGRALPSAVPSRRASVSDLFPMKDGRRWLATEFIDHLAGLARVQKPQGPGKQPRVAGVPFLTESELEMACGSKGC